MTASLFAATGSIRLVHRSRKHDGATGSGRSHRTGNVSATGAGTGRPTGASCITGHPPTQGKPWDATRAPLRWNGTQWTGDVPDYKADAPPEEFGAFIMLPEGVAKLYASDFVEGPFPEHYEPAESPVENPLHPNVGSNPAAKILRATPTSLARRKSFRTSASLIA